MAQDTVQIIVNDCKTDSFKIIVPNIFSPNADGINDVFTITHNGVNDMQLIIYNRWGLKVTEITNLNQSWDGRNTSGEPCSAGTYYYILRAKGNKETKELKGFVDLVR